MKGDTTFPALLGENAVARPDAVAMQEKRYGIWQPITWRQYQQRVADFAHGLAAAGVDRGDVVAVLGDNRPEWLIAELAVQSIGAAVVGIFPTSINEEIAHIVETADVRIVIAEDQEQVDKLIRLKATVPQIHTVIYYDPHGLEQYEHDYLRQFVDVEAAGREWGLAHPGWLDERLSACSPDDLAVICTTSGTTSRPKLGRLSHRNLLSMAEHLAEVDPIGAKDRYVSFLPFAWIGEQMLAVACGMSFGLTISFPESSATQRADLREIGPDIMFSPPRIWETMLSEVQVRIDEAGWLKRAVFGWGYNIGDKVARRKVSGESIGLGLNILRSIANQVALRPVRDQLGLARIKRGYTGGAPLGPDVFGFFHAIGVNLKQIYGQTEICGIAVLHRDTAIDFNTVGEPIPGTELSFSDSGEILLRSSAVFDGYLHNPEATSEAIDNDGWLHTGDAGYLNTAGQLVVIDRVQDVMRAPDGTQFSSAFLENKLKFSPYIEEAVVFGTPTAESGSYGDITALITLDIATVGAWAEHEHISYTTYTDLAANPQVYELIADEVDRANTDLSDSIKIRRFALLHKQFDPDDDEITRTRKIRRSVINDRYGDIISALARGDDSVDVSSVITYQDGSTVKRELSLRIYDLSTYVRPEGLARRPVWSGRR